MIRQVWKKYNVSTILILPLFNKITNNVYAKTQQQIKMPFIQLCIEYGLKNTYLYKNKKQDGNLYLVFNKKDFNTNKRLTTSKYESICELLVDCEYFQNIEITNEEIIVGLKIPEQFTPDIFLIERGNYSQISPEYKAEIKIKEKYIPKTSNELAKYVAKQNLGYCIATKHVSVKRAIEKELKIKLESEEVYEKFSPQKENLKKNS